MLSRFVRWTKDGKAIRLRIQKITPDLVDGACDLFRKHYLRDEAFSKAAGIPQNPRAMAEATLWFKEQLKIPTFSCSVCCEDKKEKIGKVLGIYCMELIKSTDQFNLPKAETKEVQKYFNLCEAFFKIYNPLEELSVPCLYQDHGLIIDPKFRSMGLLLEFIKACKVIPEREGVPIVGMVVADAVSMAAFSRYKMETVMEVDTKEFCRQNGIVMRNVAPTIKYAIMRFNYPKLVVQKKYWPPKHESTTVPDPA